MIKFGVVTDVHHSDLGKNLIAPMNDFIKEMNEEFKPDFIIELGDFYGGSDATREDLQQINNVYTKSKADTHYVLGNVDSWSDGGKEALVEEVGISNTYYSFDKNDFHCIILDGSWLSDDIPICPAHPGNEQEHPMKLHLADGDRVTGPGDPIGHVGHIPEEELNWLKKDLKATDKKTIVFCHNPINVGSLGHRLDNERDLVKMFEEQGKVKAVFTGHFPRNHHRQEQGINYFILQGMGQNPEEKFGSFSKITITDDSLKIVGKGKQVDYGVRFKE